MYFTVCKLSMSCLNILVTVSCLFQHVSDVEISADLTSNYKWAFKTYVFAEGISYLCQCNIFHSL